jgi:hypothetical protein
MSSSLADFLPETVDATQVLEKRLAPSLAKVRQGATENKAQDMVRAVKQSREAIADAQKSLRDAQQALLDRDPLFAAKMYADAAADALSKHPPDVEAASANQALASQSLNKQLSKSVRNAATATLSGVSQFRDTYATEAKGAMPTDKTSLAAAREWGTLRARPDGEVSAASREEDPTGYQKMLQVYFRTLGKTRQQGAK